MAHARSEGPRTDETKDAPRFIGEGVFPVASLGSTSPPSTWRDVASTIVLLLGGVLVLSLGDSWQVIVFGTVLLAVAALGVVRHVVATVRQARLARSLAAAHQRFEIGEAGIRSIARDASGAPIDRHYDWFMFGHHYADAMRLVAFLRVPSASNAGQQEVLLLPATFFPDDFDDLVAYVAGKLPERVAAARPVEPSARVKTLALTFVLLALLAGLYVWLGFR